jgi:LmbE family N-acetylglucosaminyl deacetylase
MTTDLSSLLASSDSALFILPHPDDELFCAGLLDLCSQYSVRRYVLWLSTGGLSGLIRRREMRRCTRTLGGDVVVYKADLPDGSFGTHSKRLMSTIRNALDELSPDIVVTTALERGHPDHNATCIACSRICARDGCASTLVLVPTYRCEKLKIVVGKRDPSFDVTWLRVRLGPRLARARLRIALCYVSQWFILLPLLLFGGIRFLRDQDAGISDKRISVDTMRERSLCSARRLIRGRPS